MIIKYKYGLLFIFFFRPLKQRLPVWIIPSVAGDPHSLPACSKMAALMLL